MEDSKPFYESKELIVLAVSSICGLLQAKFGWVVDPEIQLAIVTIVLAALRFFFTKGPVTLRK